jgi:hypothetical protein
MTACNGAHAVRWVFRYTVPVGDQVHAITLTDGSEPAAVAVAGEEVVEFWAEHCAGCPEVNRQFLVFGTGHPIPAGAKYVGTSPRTMLGCVWHLYEVAA